MLSDVSLASRKTDKTGRIPAQGASTKARRREGETARRETERKEFETWNEAMRRRRQFEKMLIKWSTPSNEECGEKIITCCAI